MTSVNQIDLVMKNLILTATMLLIFSSCKNKEPETVKFAPPVVMADEEIKAAPPAVNELKVADPGQKTVKGDPDADIQIDEPEGYSNANIAESPNHTGKLVQDTAKKIIKQGDISFETNNITATRKKILYSLKKLGGYTVEDNETTNNEEGRKEYTLKVLIPAKNFDLLLDTVSSSAYKIDSKNISVTDVTTKFIDITTRLNHKKILEGRYLDLLRKGSKISDLLEIENKLSEIRSDIESTQGQLNYLNKQVTYSSLDITFYTKQVLQADKGIGFGYKLKTAISDGLGLLQSLFFGIIALWPIILSAVIIYVLIKRWRKRRRLRAAV